MHCESMHSTWQDCALRRLPMVPPACVTSDSVECYLDHVPTSAGSLAKEFEQQNTLLALLQLMLTVIQLHAWLALLPLFACHPSAHSIAQQLVTDSAYS